MEKEEEERGGECATLSAEDLRTFFLQSTF